MSNIYCALRCTFALATLCTSGLCWAQAPAATARNLYQQAAAAIQGADYEAGIKALEELMLLDDRSLAEVARPHLAELYLASSRTAQALTFAETWLGEGDLTAEAGARFERVCLKAALQTKSLSDRKRALEQLVSRLDTRRMHAAKVATSAEADLHLAPHKLLPAASRALIGTLVEVGDYQTAQEMADRYRELDDAIAQYRLQIPLLAAKNHFTNHRIRECESALATLELDALPQDEQIAARFLMLECSLRTGQLQNATSHSDWFDTILDTFPTLPNWAATLRLRQVELLVARRDYVKARETIQLAKTAHPDFKLTYELDFLLARIAIATIDFATADSVLTELKTQHTLSSPAGIRARWMHGELEFMRRRYASAAALYEQVAACQQPKWKSIGLLQLAKCQELIGEPEKAIANYSLVLQQASQSTTSPIDGRSDTTTTATQEARRRIAALQSSASPTR